MFKKNGGVVKSFASTGFPKTFTALCVIKKIMHLTPEQCLKLIQANRFHLEEPSGINMKVIRHDIDWLIEQLKMSWEREAILIVKLKRARGEID